MIDAIGIVNFEDNSVRVEGLDQYRTIAAMSFLGRYRLIDFALSNLVNSGVDRIKVMVKDKPRSLIEHLGSGSQYNINPKHGYLEMLYPDHKAANDAYFHDVYLLNENFSFLESNHRRYVIMMPSYMVYKIDFRDVIDKHEKSGADITCVYKNVNNADKKFVGCRVAEFDNDGRIKSIKENVGASKKAAIMTEAYIMKRELFMTLLSRASSFSPLYSFINVLTAALGSLKVRGYQHTGYLSCINSLQEYYNANMELIDYEKSRELFADDWPIYTKTNDSTPAFYSKTGHAKNSLIANGCEIYGDVENCILGRGVRVSAGCTVKNSLLLPTCYIGEYAQINYAIIDKHARVEHKRDIIGTADNLIYIRRGDKV